MSRIVLHVGAGKTGSSALQTFLSTYAGTLVDGDLRYEYCSLEADGTIWRHDRVRSSARHSLMGYRASAQDLSSVDPSRFADNLRMFADGGIVPVFSQENWLAQVTRGKIPHCLAAADEVDVVAYLRPQVEWFNSGWWQWWAWDDRIAKPEDVLDVWPGITMHWGHFLQAWSNLPTVTKVYARLAPRDIVGDFLRLLGISVEHQVTMVNQAMSERMSRLYRTLPGLRQSFGPELDVVLAPYINDAGATPWVVEPRIVDRIISETRETNDLLLTFLDPVQREEMQADARWWDAAAFAERAYVPLETLQMDAQEAARLLGQAIVQTGRLYHTGKPAPDAL